MAAEPSITCPVCGWTSHNPNDIRYGYCGHCHDWTGGIHDLDQRMSEMPPWPEHFVETFGELEMYYDRQGAPISLGRYSWLQMRKFQDSDQYYRVADDDPLPGVRVSTVWDGIPIDNIISGGSPDIFETMVFVDGEATVRQRWTTADEARHGHETLVKSLELVGRSFLDEVLGEGSDDE